MLVIPSASQAAAVPRLAGRMADEAARLLGESDALFSEHGAVAELHAALAAAGPQTVEDLTAALTSFYDEWSPDESSLHPAGAIASAAIMSAVHYDGRLVGEWPTVDAFAADGREFWGGLVDDAGWRAAAAEAVVNARIAAVTSIVTAVSGALRAAGLPAAAAVASKAVDPNLVVGIGSAVAGLGVAAAIGYKAYQAWSYTAVKDVSAEPGDVVVYVARDDSRTRSSHASMNGFTFRYGSSVSKRREVWAPNGPNCRCTNQVVKGAAAAAMVISEELPADAAVADEKWASDPRNHPSDYARLDRVPKDVTRRLNAMPRGVPKLVDVGDGGMIDARTYRANGAVAEAFAEKHPNAEMFREGGRADRYFRDAAERHYGYMPELTRHEMAAVTSYSYQYDEIMNGALRGGRIRQPVSDYVKFTVHSLNKVPVYSGKVYRGAAMTDDFLASYQKGVKMTPRGFTSTSRNHDIANDFAIGRSGRGKTPVMFVIESKTGRDIAPLSIFDYEQEVLFQPGTTFEVTGRYDEPDRVVVNLTEL